jgi:polyhydroxyalkanoate synthase
MLPALREFARSPRVQNARDRVFRAQSLVQAGKTPFETIHDDGLARLRYYPPLVGIPTRHRVPLVIVAPLAINMLVYDLFENRSFIRYLLSQGFAVYLIDWGRPTRQHANRNFHSYILNAMPNMLAHARAHSGQQQLTLHGWSMAGIFTLLYAAYSQDPDLKNLIILGSPIDAHASGAIGRNYRLAGQFWRWAEPRIGWHPRRLPAKLLHSSGWSNALGFKLLDPIGTLKGHINMIKQLDDRQAVESHATLGAFLNHMVDYPGGVNRDMLLKIWLDNPLKRGEFKLGGKTVYLKDIHAALLAGAGRGDNLVTASSVRPLTRLVGSEDVTFATISGGHVGLIGSQGAADEFWPMLADWLAQRSD